MRNLGVALNSSLFVLTPQHPFVSKLWFIENIPWAHALSSPSHLFSGCYPKLSSFWACLAAFGSSPFQPIYSVKLRSKSDHAPSLMKHLIDLPLPTEWRRTPTWPTRPHVSCTSPTHTPHPYAPRLHFQSNLTLLVVATLNQMQCCFHPWVSAYAGIPVLLPSSLSVQAYCFYSLFSLTLSYCLKLN